MRLELKIPTIGESITEVEIGGWLKNSGDTVSKDEPVVSLESEKATVELPAPDSGRLSDILKKKGDVAKIGEVIGYLETGNHQPKPAPKAPDKEPALKQEAKPAAQAAPPRVMPAAQVALEERGLRPEQVQATGPGGRILKEDVLRAKEPPSAPAESQPAEERQAPAAPPPVPEGTIPSSQGARQDEVVPMSRLRR